MNIFRSILVFFLILSLVGCGEDDSPSGQGNPGENSMANNMSFLREDGSPLIMGTDYAICCGTWETGFNGQTTLKIFLYDPLSFTDPDNADSFWKIFINVEDVAEGQAYSFPTDGNSPVKVFLGDFVTGNEISSDTNDSVGTLTITSLICGSPLRVSLTIDATLGSEFHLAPTVEVAGSFSATIYSNPSPLGCDFGI